MIPLFNYRVKAGFPSPATDYVESELDFNELLINNKTATYALKAEGDSMINAGIQSGDILIVDRSIKPESNHIIIASIDGDFTVKRLLLEKKSCYLIAENPEYPQIEITEETDFVIWGVVTYVIHKEL